MHQPTGTKLRYLEEMDRLYLDSRVIAVQEHDGRDAITLDETIFYPQGGGQPYDQGWIRSAAAVFRVDEVRFTEDGEVRHIGTFQSGRFAEGEWVSSEVDAERRVLHTRVHSAGHVVDMAVNAMTLPWKPGKGYHYPEGPYVEYSGSLDGRDADQLKAEITRRCAEFVDADVKTSIRFEGPQRTVYYGTFGVLCGGTHVSRLAEIGPITIRKLKQNRDVVRVSYDVTR